MSYVCRVRAVDLMLDQLQRQRQLADAPLRLEQEKKVVELKVPQKRKEATDDAPPSVVKPVTDKRGKTIERPARPL